MQNAVSYRLIWKLGQLPHERLVHLVGGALEEPPAAAEEERVAGEDGRRVAAAREEVADVAGGVAGREHAGVQFNRNLGLRVQL